MGRELKRERKKEIEKEKGMEGKRDWWGGPETESVKADFSIS